MGTEDFKKVATEVKAEQFFAEHRPAALNPVDLLALEKVAQVEDLELLAVAQQYCPEAPLRFYEEELGGTFKDVG